MKLALAFGLCGVLLGSGCMGTLAPAGRDCTPMGELYLTYAGLAADGGVCLIGPKAIRLDDLPEGQTVRDSRIVGYGGDILEQEIDGEGCRATLKKAEFVTVITTIAFVRQGGIVVAQIDVRQGNQRYERECRMECVDGQKEVVGIPDEWRPLPEFPRSKYFFVLGIGRLRE